MASKEGVELLSQLVKEFGLATAVSIFLIVFLIYLVGRSFNATIKAYESNMRNLNTMNKKYQDYFLENRNTSGRKELGE